MKKLLLFMSMLISLGVFSACSKSDEFDSYVSSSNGKYEVDSVQDDIHVSFSLLNDKGKPDSLFRYGEDICFELMITNKSDKDLFMFGDVRLGNKLFAVYREDGTFVGTPWTSIGTDFSGNGIKIRPNSSGRYTCKWIGRGTDGPIQKDHELDPLPKGSYYTKFIVKHRDLKNVIEDMFIEKEFYSRFIIQ